MKFSEFFEQNQNENIPHIFVDMDGVLVDFAKAFRNISGENIDSTEYENLYGSDKFWEIITAAGEDFWKNMTWTSDGKVLWNYIKKYNPIILSAPSKSESSIIGKIKWLQKNIPDVNAANYTTSLRRLGDERVILNKNKFMAVSHDKNLKNLAGEIKTRGRRGDDVSELQKQLDMRRKQYILIDDMLKNIIPWEKAGGIGILHTNTNDTIKKLKKIIS